MATGTRVTGHNLRFERWYRCAITGLDFVESATTVPDPPHPQAGLRVWLGALDELDRDTLRTINGPPDSGTDFIEDD